MILSTPQTGASAKAIAKPLKRGKACLNCRFLKIKCDGAKPICGPCERHPKDDPCEYSDGPGRSRTKVLEEQVSRLEARLYELEHPDASAPSVTLHRPYPDSRRLSKSTPSLLIPDARRMTPIAPSSPTSTSSSLPSDSNDGCRQREEERNWFRHLPDHIPSPSPHKSRNDSHNYSIPETPPPLNPSFKARNPVTPNRPILPTKWQTPQDSKSSTTAIYGGEFTSVRGDVNIYLPPDTNTTTTSLSPSHFDHPSPGSYAYSYEPPAWSCTLNSCQPCSSSYPPIQTVQTAPDSYQYSPWIHSLAAYGSRLLSHWQPPHPILLSWSFVVAGWVMMIPSAWVGCPVWMWAWAWA